MSKQPISPLLTKKEIHNLRNSKLYMTLNTIFVVITHSNYTSLNQFEIHDAIAMSQTIKKKRLKCFVVSPFLIDEFT